MKAHRLLLIAMTAFLSLTFIDETGVAVILPDMQSDFGTTSGKTHWVLNAFFVSLAMFVALFGRLSDAIGARRLFMWGCAVFALASAGCALAPSVDLLIAMRFVKGVGAAMMLATYAVLILRTVGPEVQGLALGICAGYAAFFLATGPFIGGLVAEHLGWRALFALNLPICALIAIFSLRAVSQDAPTSPASVSWLSALATTLAIGFLVAALMVLAEHMSLTQLAQGLFLLAAVAMAVMLWLSLKNSSSGVVEWALFRIPSFSAANVLLFTTQAAVMCVALWAIYLQLALGMSPLMAGLALLPAGLPILVMGRVGGAWADRSGPWRPMLLGSFLVLAGMVVSAVVALQQSYILLVAAMLLYGVGAPLTISPGIAAVMRVAPLESQGAAAGIFNTARHLGAAVGIALFAVVLSIVDQSLSADYLRSAQLDVQTAQQALASGASGDPVLSAIFARAFAYANWVLVALAAIGFGAAVLGQGAAAAHSAPAAPIRLGE